MKKAKIAAALTLLLLCTACANTENNASGDTTAQPGTGTGTSSPREDDAPPIDETPTTEGSLPGVYTAGDFEIVVTGDVGIVSEHNSRIDKTLKYVMIPVSVTNTSEATAALDESLITYFGADSAADESVMSVFEANNEILNKIRAGGTINGAFYMQYTEDGEYAMDIDGKELTVNVILPEALTDTSFLDVIPEEALREDGAFLLERIPCQTAECEISDGTIIITATPVAAIIENTQPYFNCRNTADTVYMEFDIHRAQLYGYVGTKIIIQNCILSDGSIGDFVFEYEFK